MRQTDIVRSVCLNFKICYAEHQLTNALQMNMKSNLIVILIMNDINITHIELVNAFIWLSLSIFPLVYVAI